MSEIYLLRLLISYFFFPAYRYTFLADMFLWLKAATRLTNVMTCMVSGDEPLKYPPAG